LLLVFLFEGLFESGDLGMELLDDGLKGGGVLGGLF
jgi:hypothetical protein